MQVIIDGTRQIPDSWELCTSTVDPRCHDDDIWVTTAALSWDIWQLFDGDDMLVNARWPNAKWSDKSIFEASTAYALSDSTSTQYPPEMHTAECMLHNREPDILKHYNECCNLAPSTDGAKSFIKCFPNDAPFTERTTDYSPSSIRAAICATTSPCAQFVTRVARAGCPFDKATEVLSTEEKRTKASNLLTLLDETCPDPFYDGVIAPSHELALASQTDLDATGSIVVLNIGSWDTFTDRVTSHTPGSNVFGYSGTNVCPDCIDGKATYSIKKFNPAENR